MAKNSGGTKAKVTSSVKENTEEMYDHLSGTLADDVLDKEDSISIIMDTNNTSYDKAEEYWKAIQKYTEDNIAEESVIEEFIKTAPKWYGDETFRAIGVSDELLSQFKIGGTYTPGRISSWSTNENTAIDSFADYAKGNKVLFRCDSQPKGTSVVHASYYPGDSEVLVSKKASYRITDIYKDGSITVVELQPKQR